jgi:hypothetical protein
MPSSGRSTPKKHSVILILEPGRTPGLVWTCAESLARIAIRSPDCPARSDSHYRVLGQTLSSFNIVCTVCGAEKNLQKPTLGTLRGSTTDGQNLLLHVSTFRECVLQVVLTVVKVVLVLKTESTYKTLLNLYPYLAFEVAFGRLLTILWRSQCLQTQAKPRTEKNISAIVLTFQHFMSGYCCVLIEKYFNYFCQCVTALYRRDHFDNTTLTAVKIPWRWQPWSVETCESVMCKSNACNVGFYKLVVPGLFEKKWLSILPSSGARQQLESTAILWEDNK